MNSEEIKDLIQLARESFIAAIKDMESAHQRPSSPDIRQRRQTQCAEWAAIYTAAIALESDPEAEEPLL